MLQLDRARLEGAVAILHLAEALAVQLGPQEAELPEVPEEEGGINSPLFFALFLSAPSLSFVYSL